MIDKTIIGLIMIVNTWIISPILPTIFKSFQIKMLTPLTRMLTLTYRDFFKSFLHIYPQKLKKKGYVNAVNKNTKT